MKTRWAFLLCGLLIAAPAMAVLDQSQESNTYYYFCSDEVIRWQEFVPTMSTLDQVDVCFFRGIQGTYGDVMISVWDAPPPQPQQLADNGGPLWSDVIANGDIPTGANWVSVAVPSIALTPGQSYYIALLGNWSQWPVGEALGWLGERYDNPYPAGTTDVGDVLPDFDYAFRTYGVPEPATMALLAIGGTLLRKRRA